VKPIQLEKEREETSNWQYLVPFYYKYICLIEKRKYKPCFILNFDEVSLHSPHSINQLCVSIDGDNFSSTPTPLSLSNSTLLLCCACDGSQYPSTVLISQKNIPFEFLQKSSENLRFISSSPKGWMTREILESIMEYIIIPSLNKRRIILNCINDPVLIIVDGHNSRFSGKLYDLCISNNIDLLCIPPHTSHILQPLDKGVNATFKNEISKFKNYKTRNVEREKRIVFIEALLKSLQSALQYSIIIHSWKVTGLSPFNPFIVLKNWPINPPKYLQLKQHNNTKINISGKLLVYSSLNYSINNLHVDFQNNNLLQLKSLTDFNEKQKNLVEKLISESTEECSVEYYTHLETLNKHIFDDKEKIRKIETNSYITEENIEGLLFPSETTVNMEEAENYNQIEWFNKELRDEIFATLQQIEYNIEKIESIELIKILKKIQKVLIILKSENNNSNIIKTILVELLSVANNSSSRLLPDYVPLSFPDFSDESISSLKEIDEFIPPRLSKKNLDKNKKTKKEKFEKPTVNFENCEENKESEFEENDLKEVNLMKKTKRKRNICLDDDYYYF
jgi:hypothetical protein